MLCGIIGGTAMTIARRRPGVSDGLGLGHRATWIRSLHIRFRRGAAGMGLDGGMTRQHYTMTGRGNAKRSRAQDERHCDG